MQAETKRKMWLTINIVSFIFFCGIVHHYTSKVNIKYDKIQSMEKQEMKIAEQRLLEEKQCMDKHRWDTTAVNTSRMAIQMQSHRMGKGELAKYVSDYDAVKIVYCSGK